MARTCPIAEHEARLAFVGARRRGRQTTVKVWWDGRGHGVRIRRIVILPLGKDVTACMDGRDVERIRGLLAGRR
jgi:hypothetical protein